MTSPKFSIILPTYNRKYCLRQAIESVLSQTFQEYELIIVDDGSTDGTLNWLQENYSSVSHPQIRTISLSQNCGPSVARNVAIKQAKGRWIAFIDSDDQWLPEFLERHQQALQSHDNIAMSACDAIAIRQHKPNEKIRAESKVWSIYPNATHHMLMSSLIWSMSLVAMNRHYLLKAGLLNEQLRMCEDRELYLRLLHYGDYVHIPNALVIKNQGKDSLTLDFHLYSKEVIRAIDFFLDSPSGTQYQHLRNIAKSRWSMNIARTLFEQKHDFIFACFMILRGLYYSPDLFSKAIQRRLHRPENNNKAN